MDVNELDSIRHDLGNVLTALRSGCLLIESSLGKRSREESDSETRELIEEMRARIEAGAALVERLRVSTGH
ncbi:MAG: hypothetical protein KDC95_16455 [Planctomycetes bacterium]|nr:hypothetical protein [Planctomycetota bacterium]